MSRTFEALRKAERERRSVPGDVQELDVSPPKAGRRTEGKVLNPPSAASQSAALDLETGLQDVLGGRSGPVVLVPGVPAERFGRVIVDTAATLVLRRGLRLLVIEVNPVSPVLHRFLGVSRSRGCSDLLCGRGYDIREIRVSGADGAVDFLPAGSGRPPDVSWPDRLAFWLDNNSGSYDRILVAGPPPDEEGLLASLAGLGSGTVLILPQRARFRSSDALLTPGIVGIVMVG